MAIKRSLPARTVSAHAGIGALKKMFDAAKAQVIVTDADAHIVYANSSTEQVTGFALGEMLGKNPADLWGGNMPHALWVKAWKTLKQKKKPVTVDVRNIGKDKRERWQSLHISPILDEKKRIAYFLGMEIDITGAKRARLKKVGALSALGTKALGPLTGVRWILECLQNENALTIADARQVLIAHSEAKKSITLLRKMLAGIHTSAL